MELLFAMLAFFALVASWFALPATPPAAPEPVARPVEGLRTAA